MWKAVSLDDDHSGWREISHAENLKQLKSLGLEDSAAGEIHYFWDGPYPEDPEALQDLYETMCAANGGMELRLMVGATVGSANIASSGCSGALCFCTVQGGSRYCEVCWQGSSGAVCKPCGGSC